MLNSWGGNRDFHIRMYGTGTFGIITVYIAKSIDNDN